MRPIYYVAGIVGCLLMASCTATEQFAGAGAALVLGAVEYATASGEMSEEVGNAIITGVGQIGASIENVEKAQAGTLTTGEAQAWGGGLAAAVIGGLRLWRGKPSKGMSKGLQNVIDGAKASD